MTYNWIAFNLSEALAGTLVGFPVEGKSYDLSNTGTLTGPGPVYTVKIGGYTLRVLEDGSVNKVTPANASWLNQTLQMVTTDMGSEAAVGSSITRSAGSSGEGQSATAVLSTMEPRDHFAMNVLSSMLVHMENPEAKDDATMIKYSRAAYRWAQAMMIAAADSREGTSTTPSTQVDVNSGDLQSNTEKLLYNIADSLKNGIIIKPKTGEPLQTETKVKEMPTTTHVTVDGTPNVSVSNSPTVSVSNMPTEPIDVAVTSMPSST